MAGWSRQVAIVVVISSLASPLFAQRGSTTQSPAQTGAERSGAPPRDNVQQPGGTAVIRGRVLTAETGTPVRRAQVRATAAEARAGRLATTDAQGRFELRDLPAGRWVLTASKAGFVSLQYGQRHPLESGRAIELRNGEILERADISLPRGSALTGHVYDEFGDAIAGARVQVLRYQLQQGIRRLAPAGGGDLTDDTGAFRVFGLAPGEYFVSATLRAGTGNDAGADGGAYAPTYFPGTGNLSEAQRVTLGVSQEQSNVNFALLPVRTVRISGMALNAAGESLTGGTVTLSPSGDAALAFNIGGSVGRVRSDGTFALTNVTPGTYTLTATTDGPGRRGGGPTSGADTEFASLPLIVGTDDLSGLTVVTAKGATLAGMVGIADDSTGELNLSALRVVAQGVRPDLPGAFNANRNSRVNDDASFVLSGLSGQRVLRLNGLPQGWVLKAVMQDSADVTDTPFDFRGNEQLGDIRILVSDRVTEISGRALSRGQPVRDYSVVVFADDQARWTFPTRFVQTARADQQGVFRIRALPAGERYLAVAVDYLENGESADPQFLAQLRSRATPLTLADGEAKALDLTLTAR